MNTCAVNGCQTGSDVTLQKVLENPNSKRLYLGEEKTAVQKAEEFLKKGYKLEDIVCSECFWGVTNENDIETRA